MMGGFVVQVDSTRKMVFYPEITLRLIRDNIVDTPTLEKKDIEDHSKASWVTKSLAIIQIIWFLTQLLARAIQKLPVTTLELFTLSIVSCVCFTYGFHWHKPFDVQRPIVLKPKAPESQWPVDIKRMKFGLFASNADLSRYLSMSLPIVLLFSSCHLIGWDFAFPSDVEQWLWRAGSLCCLVLPFAVFLAAGYNLEGGLKDWVFPTLILSYVAVRIALFVEMFTSLRSAPAGVYQTPRWTDYVPSFGT